MNSRNYFSYGGNFFAKRTLILSHFKALCKIKYFYLIRHRALQNKNLTSSGTYEGTKNHR